jgi:hypothetical protein
MRSDSYRTMKRYLLIVLLFPIQALRASGPDEMILWRYQAPIVSEEHFSLSTGQIYRQGMKGIFLYSNPYRINSLGWNYAGLKYGSGHWGIIGSFRSYSLSDLYSDYRASLGLAVNPLGEWGLSAGCNYGREEFGRGNKYAGFNLDLGLSYTKDNLSGELAMKRINVKMPYDFPRRAEPQVTGAINLGDGMIFTAGYKRLYTKEGRWFFRQDIDIIEGASLDLGYINNPNILHWGLDLSWKSLNFNFVYLVVGRLNDTMAMGLSWGH